MLRRVPMVVLALLFAVAAVPPAEAGPPIRWAKKRVSPLCEPPHVFYSSAHVAGRSPCCATIEGLCPGGSACPANGLCADNSVCVPGPVVDRPNIILFISDDHGACHYGTAGECRSAQTGTPVPVPKTPNVDLLAGYGTMFPVAHNTASWCFPSLASMLTGRYQKDFGGQRRVNETFFETVPSVLRGLTGDPNAVPDSFNVGNAVGGYCTLLAGKFIGSLDDNTFDARARTGGRKLGRNECVAGPPGSPPRCGTATSPSAYQPFVVGQQTDVFNFLDMLLYKVPGSAPAQYAMQHFFVWYAPRIPHQPLRAPQPIKDYLFGGLGSFPLGGVMNLGQWCTNGSCAPVVQAFDENNFGTVHEFFSNVWWADDNVRELRKYLAMQSAPHCIGADGRSRFDITNPAQCSQWSSVLPDLPRNTIFMFMSDNGWHLPKSKHGYTENGYRTALFVFDPRNLPEVPHWDPALAGPPPAPYVTDAIAHTNDVLPTALGYALGTPGAQACPVGPDGRACDGRDLRPLLATAPGGPAAPETLRHALCGHQTKRPTRPDSNRFLVTRSGTVGRCTRAANAACTTTADCPPGDFCLGGRCATPSAEPTCSVTSTCPAGAACLGGRCRLGPPCIDDDACAMLGAGYVCGGKEQRWCRNDPNVACTTRDDCPACPTVNGNPVPCKRLCEARTLKFYASPGTVPGPELVDLFVDPDEQGAHKDPNPLLKAMSSLSGPYASTMRKLNCCIDEWWPEVAGELGSLCTSGNSCPSDFSCIE